MHLPGAQAAKRFPAPCCAFPGDRRDVFAVLASPAETGQPTLLDRSATARGPALPKPTCCACWLELLGLGFELSRGDVRLRPCSLYSRRLFLVGEALFHEGEPFRFLHMVRSGTFKACHSRSDGREHVSGFSLSGDVIGLDGVLEGHHQCSVIALENSRTCGLSIDTLLALAAVSVTGQIALMRLMGREISRGRAHALLLGTLEAAGRLAAFLIDMSERALARGYSPKEFHLRMTRADIGSHLGMTTETVSRNLSALKQLGVLDVASRRIRIMNQAGLRDISRVAQG